jgi:hypothetical protein
MIVVYVSHGFILPHIGGIYIPTTDTIYSLRINRLLLDEYNCTLYRLTPRRASI